MPETHYQPIPYVFTSKGISARMAVDRVPPGGYLNLQGCYERQEDAMSSRYGSRIINRDPDEAGSGVNYYFPDPVQTISRLKYNSNTYRYAGAGDTLYRRVGDTQGQYTSIYGGLSGQPFGSASTSCFGSSLNYLFIADLNGMIKDSGTGTPTQWGITPPNQPANAIEYGPIVLLIDGFTDSLGAYDLTNVSGWSSVGIGVVNVSSETPVNNFLSFDASSGLTTAFNGALATPSTGDQSVIFNIFNSPNPAQFSAINVDATEPTGATDFTLTSYSGTVAANTTGTISRTVNLDLSQDYQVTDDDLIALSIQLSDPAAIQQINLKFDVNNSGYTSSYYSKSISPAYYQSGISGNTDAYTTASNEILALSLGLLTGTNTAGAAQKSSQIVQQLQSATANTGQNAWSTIYSRRGDFLAVGNAGQPGFDWSSVTGWQVEIVTTTNASVEISLNGIYLQWGAGPSSFGGTGYDYRYTYFNALTKTESNPSGIQYFDQKYGYVASYMAPIVLRQAINVQGIFSTDPQVTHVRLYRKGGSVADNWHYLDQFPNVIGAGTFSYSDILPDVAVFQGDLLQLDNDAPVTSTLQDPIVTELDSPTVGPGTSPYDLFVPQAVTVADSSAVFVPNQTVVVGTPQNLEEVQVITGGMGGFTAVFRLTHAAGEQVQVFSVPQQPCDLVAEAYGQLWVAGDKLNPHYLYYSKKGFPENFGPQRHIPVGTPQSPIMAVINWRGTLYVATLTTWYQIVPGNPPYAQSTGSTHGLVSRRGWAKAESAVWYEAIDGIREFRGSDGPYRTLPIEWVYQGINLTPIPLVDQNQIGTVSMGFRRNTVYAAYTALDGTRNRLLWSTDYCVPDTAEALTPRGWRTRSELRVGDEILAYDSESDTCKWTAIQELNVFDYDGNLINFNAGRNGRKFDVLCTPNHKWWWVGETGKGKNWRKQPVRARAAKDIRKFGEIKIAAPLDKGEKRSLLTPTEAAILGWIVTDGTITINPSKGPKKRRSSRIYQRSDKPEVGEIRSLVKGNCTSEQVRRVGFMPIGKNGKRALPCEMICFLLSTEFTERLFEKCGFVDRGDLSRIACQLDSESAFAMYSAMLHADGHEGRQTWLAQKDRRVSEAFQILAVMCGMSTAFTAVYSDGTHRVSSSKCQVLSCENIRRSERHHDGKVWCPTTRYSSWVMRQGDCVCITGNSRWRNDDVPALTMYLEEDTQTLLYAKFMDSGGDSGYAICEEAVNDYDDGGWVGGLLTKTSIGMNCQLPYQDLNEPHYPKQWNMFEVDANTQGQTVTLKLNFDDGIAPLTLGTLNTTERKKVQFKVNAGKGQESYKCSPELTASVKVAPYIYQINAYADKLAADRTSLDVYWWKFGMESSKLCKQVYLDYTATAPVTLNFYVDGKSTPYWTDVLPARPTRAIIRVRLPALTFRTWRMIALSNEPMQTWAAPRAEWKPVEQTSGYQISELPT